MTIHDLAYSRITTYNWMTMKPFIFLSQELVNHLNHRQLLFIHSKSKNDCWFITLVKIRSQFSKFSKYFYRNCCSHMFYRIAILKFSTRQKKTLAMKTFLASNFPQKRLLHRCFSVSFIFLRIAFAENTFQRPRLFKVLNIRKLKHSFLWFLSNFESSTSSLLGC